MSAILIFHDLPHLLGALHSYRGGKSQSYPENVHQGKGGQWCIPFSELAADNAQSLDSFGKLSRQLRWNVTVTDQMPPGRSVRLLDMVLGGPWHYLDPVKIARDGAPFGTSSSSTTENVLLETFILGAGSDEEASRLLNVLTGFLGSGIQAHPWLRDVLTPSPSEFSYFWKVSKAYPQEDDRPLPLAIMQAARRTWWGPVGYGKPMIFFQWPYRLNVPVELLSKLSWDSGEVVLLSKERPQVVILRATENAPIFHDLIEVADLQPSQSPIAVHVSAAVASPPDVSFKVSLRLIQQSPKRLLDSTIEALKREIRAKEAMLEIIDRDPKPLDDDVPLEREPLHLYFGDADEVPFQLRRLLIEWSDQPESLQSLRYMKLDATPLGEVMGTRGSCVHVLTTDTALGQSVSAGLGLRLQEYQPSIGGLVAFDQLPEWSRYHLRLFVPSGHYLALYPDLRPNSLAANKLREALRPNPAAADGCVLLVPSSHGAGLHAVHLPVRGFRPLAEAFQWRCAIDASPVQPLTIEQFAGKVREEVLDGIDDEFVTSIREEGERRLEQARNGLKQSIKDHQQTITGLKRVLVALHKNEKQLASQIALAEQAGTTARPFANLAAILQGKRQELGGAEQAVKAVQDTLAELEIQAAKLEGEINQSRQLLQRRNQMLGQINHYLREP